MPVDAGTIESQIRIKLDKLSGDIKQVNALFDSMADRSKKSSKEIEGAGVSAFAQITNAIKRSIGSFNDFSQNMKKTGGDMTKFVTLPIVAMGTAMVKTAADMEMYQASFETLLGSAEQASKLLKEMKDFAAATPFGFADLAKASKTMLGFGIESSKIMPNLRMLGDIAQGNANKLDSLTLAFSQIQSTGRLMGQDLLQLINAGFNPLTIISQQTGRSMVELKKEMEGGAISADMVAGAFETATSKGGLFFNGMARASKTFSGQWSTLIDNVKSLAQGFGEILLPVAKDVIAWVSGLIKGFSSLNEGTKKIILAVAGFAAIAGPVIAAIGGLLTAFAALSPVVIGIGLGLSAIAAIGIASTMSSGARETDNLRSRASELDKNLQELKKSTDEYKKANDELNTKSKDLNATEKVMLEQRKSLAGQAVLANLQSTIKSIEELDKAQKESNRTTNINSKIVDDWVKKYKIFKEARENIIASGKRYITIENQINSAGNNTIWSLSEIDKKMQELNSGIAGFTTQNAKASVSMDDSNKKRQDSIDYLATALNQGQIELLQIQRINPEIAKTIELRAKELALKKDTNEEDAKTPATPQATKATAKDETEGLDEETAKQRALIAELDEKNYVLSQYKKIMQDNSDANKQLTEEEEKAAQKAAELKKNLDAMYAGIKAGVPQALDAFSGLFSALYEQRMNELDAQLQRELEAAGVAEDTAVEKAQKELDAAREGGDAQVIAEKEKSLRRAQIEEQYQKKRAKLEYEAAHVKWQFDLASAIVQGAIMIENAWNSALFPFNLPALALAGLISGAQIGAVTVSEPKAPSFQTGGIVPGDQYSGDHINARLNSREMVINQQQQAALWNFIRNGSRGNGDININNQFGDVRSDVDMERTSRKMARQVAGAQRSR